MNLLKFILAMLIIGVPAVFSDAQLRESLPPGNELEDYIGDLNVPDEEIELFDEDLVRNLYPWLADRDDRRRGRGRVGRMRRKNFRRKQGRRGRGGRTGRRGRRGRGGRGNLRQHPIVLPPGHPEVDLPFVVNHPPIRINHPRINHHRGHHSSSSKSRK